jgi:hypothetical protein
MFKLPPDVNILHRGAGGVDSFFERTWMDGIGVIYSTPEDDKHQALKIVLNQTRARAASEEPFTIYFSGKDARVLVSSCISSLVTSRRKEEEKKVEKISSKDRSAAEMFLLCGHSRLWGLLQTYEIELVESS